MRFFTVAMMSAVMIYAGLSVVTGLERALYLAQHHADLALAQAAEADASNNGR